MQMGHSCATRFVVELAAAAGAATAGAASVDADAVAGAAATVAATVAAVVGESSRVRSMTTRFLEGESGVSQSSQCVALALVQMSVQAEQARRATGTAAAVIGTAPQPPPRARGRCE